MLKNSTPTNLKLDNKDIDEVKHFNYLGVYLDNNLTMEIHKKKSRPTVDRQITSYTYFQN